MSINNLRPLVARGRFFVITPDGVGVHLLTDTALNAYWRGVEIADTRTRNPEEAKQQLRDQTFRVSGSYCALPAIGIEALMWIMDRYEGPHQVTVRAYAAAIILGEPLHKDNWGGDIEGGTRVPQPKPLPSAPRPGGAVFNEITDNKKVLESVG